MNYRFVVLVWTLLLSISITAQNYTIAKPRKGEGVYAFLSRHNLKPSQYSAQFYKLNEGKFGRNQSLLAQYSYKLPTSETKINESLYGKERGSFKLESNEMEGAAFYLVSGHGGPDPGAIGIYGGKKLHEDEYAYDITLRLAKKLQENGAKVHMIIQDEDDGIRDEPILNYDNHETCMGETIPLDQKKRLRQRAHKVNQLSRKDTEGYKRCVILHVDSRSKGQQVDVFFYHYSKSKTGKKTATTMRDVMKQKYKEVQPNRGFKGTVGTRNLHMLTQTNPTAVFIEIGNIQNYRDQLRVVKADNRQALANWMYDGLKADYLSK